VAPLFGGSPVPFFFVCGFDRGGGRCLLAGSIVGVGTVQDVAVDPQGGRFVLDVDVPNALCLLCTAQRPQG